MSQFIHLYSELSEIAKEKGRRGEGYGIPQTLDYGKKMKEIIMNKKEMEGRKGRRLEGRSEEKMKKDDDGFHFI